MWIKGFEDRYEITRDGRVLFHKNGNVTERKLVPDKNGYMTVNIKLNGKVFCKKIHREVGKAFIPPFDGEHINHKNGVKHDNSVDNLEWCSNIDNLKHMRDTGLKPVGIKYSNNATGYYGVSNKSGRFVARVRRGSKEVYLGSYATPEEASAVVQEMLLKELNAISPEVEVTTSRFLI
jgi:myo-inositol-hexaphosphate 3-phosphohydrolase